MKLNVTLLLGLLALAGHFEIIQARYFAPRPKCRVWKIHGKVYQNCFYGTEKTRTSTSTSTITSTSTRTSTTTSTSTRTSTSTMGIIEVAVKNYWSFNGNLQDSLTSLYLTPNFTVTYVADRKGNANSAVYLNSNYLALPAAVYFSGSMSVTVWLYMVSIGGYNRPPFLDCGTSTFGQYDVYLSILSTNYYAGFFLYTPSTRSAMEAVLNIATNTWYFYAGTSNSATGVFYINGVSYATTTTYAMNAVTRDKCFFGLSAAKGDPLLQVYADEVRFFNRALTAAEVVTVMNLSP